MPDVHPFWDIVRATMDKYERPLFNFEGYLQIVAHGVEYRSIPESDHGSVAWVSWEPFKTIPHYSFLTDPDATIEWVKGTSVD